MSFFEMVKNSTNMDMGIPIRIPQQLLHQVIKEVEGLKDTTLFITNDGITIEGKTVVEKLFIKKEVAFTIKLLPVKTVNREIYFKIEEFKPLNLNILNKKIFHNPPYLHFDEKLIKIDFNNWEIVKKVPIGNIKKFKLKDGKIVLYIGI